MSEAEELVEVRRRMRDKMRLWTQFAEESHNPNFYNVANGISLGIAIVNERMMELAKQCHS